MPVPELHGALDEIQDLAAESFRKPEHGQVKCVSSISAEELETAVEYVK